MCTNPGPQRQHILSGNRGLCHAQHVHLIGATICILTLQHRTCCGFKALTHPKPKRSKTAGVSIANPAIEIYPCLSVIGSGSFLWQLGQCCTQRSIQQAPHPGTVDAARSGGLLAAKPSVNRQQGQQQPQPQRLGEMRGCLLPVDALQDLHHLATTYTISISNLCQLMTAQRVKKHWLSYRDFQGSGNTKVMQKGCHLRCQGSFGMFGSWAAPDQLGNIKDVSE